MKGQLVRTRNAMSSAGARDQGCVPGRGMATAGYGSLVHCAVWTLPWWHLAEHLGGCDLIMGVMKPDDDSSVCLPP